MHRKEVKRVKNTVQQLMFKAMARKSRSYLPYDIKFVVAHLVRSTISLARIGLIADQTLLNINGALMMSSRWVCG
jgi:hypothetical protein